MAIREPIGLMKCPECGLDGAHVKESKSLLLYRWCPDCNAQYFPRTVEASERLRAQMSPVTVTGSGEAKPEPETPAAPVTVTKPAAPERSGFSLKGL